MKRKKLLSKLYTVLMLIIVDVALIITSFSWYNNNRKVEDNQLPVTTDVSSEVACGDYLVYIKHLRDDTGVLLDQPIYEIRNTLDNVPLNTYDSVFGRNEETPVIIRIPVFVSSTGNGKVGVTINRKNVDALEGKTDEFGLKATETFTQSANADDPKNYALEKDLLVNYISNISTYKFCVVSSLNSVDANNAKGIYEGSHTYFDSYVLDKSSFATQTKSGKIYTVNKTTNSLSGVVNYSSSDITTDTVTGAKVLYLYVEMDYDPYLVAAYLQNHNQNFKVGKLGNVELLKFVGDLSTIEMSVSE